MKQLTLILAFTATALFWSCNQQSTDYGQTINPLLGDISFVREFGYKPTATTDEVLRIKTHLAYVEKLLRKKDVSNLTLELQAKRRHLLDLLNDYRTTGIFPRNYDYAEKRVPCFIDKDGKICAVGYLIEQTEDRQFAEQINNRYKYDKISAMNDHSVDSWIATNGLTKEECAMIQPAYGPTPICTYNHITTAYGISSSVFGVFNLSLNTLNGIQIAKGIHSRAVPVIGLITGAGQITLGAAMFPNEQNGWDGNYTNESQKTLSMVNIGLGSTTIILSAWNLISNRKPKDKQTTWNIYRFPMQSNKTGLAFSLTRRF